MKNILWILVVVLVIGWILGFFVFKILGGVIHLLLVVAAVLLIYNFVSGKRV